MDENRTPTPAPSDKPTPIYKRILALLGVAAVLGFVAWQVVNMMSL